MGSATQLICTNIVRIGTDGLLWLVDPGSPIFGESIILLQGPKLVAVNLTTNFVQKIYITDDDALCSRLLDDVRIKPASGKAYPTNAGAPTIIILDVAIGGTVQQ